MLPPSGDFPDGPTVLPRVTRPQPACRLVSASPREGLLTRHFMVVVSITHAGSPLAGCIADVGIIIGARGARLRHRGKLAGRLGGQGSSGGA